MYRFRTYYLSQNPQKLRLRFSFSAARKAMGKSDDSIIRRRNKKIVRKQENKKDPSSQVSARVASIIAAKKRRQTGKRSMCQSMCFTLPTPEDPFNERQGKTEPTKKRKRDNKANKKVEGYKTPRSRLKQESLDNVGKHTHSFMGPEIAINVGKPTCQIIKWDGSKYSWTKPGSEKITESPSEFLITCLNSIQTATNDGGASNGEEGDKPLFGSGWGLEFWNCYHTGKDVIETKGGDSTLEQISWVASSAVDAIPMKEKEGLPLSGPFLLFLVPSRDKASKVRQIFKPLKELGIHSVSLHPGASINYQVNGLKSCEPEFLVSTPDRLLELLSLKAVDISGISLLVVDGLEFPFKGAYFDEVKSIREFISGNPQTVIFCDCMNNSSVSVVQKLLGGTHPQTSH